jgi:hypothetical protein
MSSASPFVLFRHLVWRTLIHGDVPHDLHHSALIGMLDHPRHMNFSGTNAAEEQHVIGHQPAPGADIGGKEIHGHQYVHVRADKFVPGGDSLAGWCGGNLMVLENIAHSLITDRIAHMLHATDKPIIVPRAILSSQTHHQSFQVFVDLGPASGLPLPRASALLSDQLPMLRQDRVEFDNGGDFLRHSFIELLTHRSQDLSITLVEPHTASDLLTE